MVARAYGARDVRPGKLRIRATGTLVSTFTGGMHAMHACMHAYESFKPSHSGGAAPAIASGPARAPMPVWRAAHAHTVRLRATPGGTCMERFQQAHPVHA